MLSKSHRNGQRSYADDENPYWISFSDIMAGLLVIFVLAALVLILELTETKFRISIELQNLIKAESIRRDILEEMRDELEKKNIQVEISENHTVIRIPENVLAFETNQYRIPSDPRVQSTIYEIGITLQKLISKDERWRYLDTIFVEGHTDIRASNRSMGNWGLSTYRAISVWNFWENHLPDNKRLSTIMNHGGEEKLFSVSGYGETRPIEVVQVTEEQLERNRRIDLRFTIKRPGSAELKNLINQLGG